jgi:flagellar hook-associated protein 3 FlgL
MRIASSTLYQLGLSGINAQQNSLLNVQQQLATGRSILRPSDDPVGATRAVNVSLALATNSQFSTSRKQANSDLGLEENALQSVTTTIQNIQSLVVAAGNGTLSDADRASIATQLQSNYDQLLGLANSDDGNGQFLFGGTKTGSAPFTVSSTGGISYVGDTGAKQLQVDISRQMATTDNGLGVFQSVQSTADYIVAAGTANTGTGTYSALSVTDPTNPRYGHDLTVSFATDPVTGATTYDVTDNTIVPPDPTPLVAAQPYTPGSAITAAGITFAVSGTPVAGDTFVVKPAQQAGTDIFANVQAAITALRKPTTSDADRAALQNVLSTANRQMSNSLDNVLTVRSSVGSRMNELDALDTVGDNKDLNYSTTLSQLQDVDYNSAIAEYYKFQTSLQAAQQSFIQIQGMNLFKYVM